MQIKTTLRFHLSLVKMAMEPLLAYIQRNVSGHTGDTCTPMFVATLFPIAKIWNQPRCLTTDDWINKMYTCTMEYYSTIKKNEIMPFAGK
jgi:hypothetical protein